MKTLVIIVFLAFTGLIAGCQKDSTTSPYTPACDGTVKSYATDVAPLISSYCSECHSQYSTYAKLKASASKVRSVIVNGSMPEGTTLSSAQKDAIICWIDNGTLNN